MLHQSAPCAARIAVPLVIKQQMAKPNSNVSGKRRVPFRFRLMIHVLPVPLLATSTAPSLAAAAWFRTPAAEPPGRARAVPVPA